MQKLCLLSFSAYPEWVEHINDTERDLGSEWHWPCVATGKPLPTIRWLKNGLPVSKHRLAPFELCSPKI